jgi:hypothetical protein
MENNWRKKHWEELKSLAGNWIAYERGGDILAWDKKQKMLLQMLILQENPIFFIIFIR